MEFTWIKLDFVLSAHKRQLAEHGGTEGVRDIGLLHSALARPENLLPYGENVDAPALAASYAFGIAKNHPFLDGNKRTAMVVAITFLNRNGWDFEAPLPDVYAQFLGLAEGTVTEEDLAVWLRDRLTTLKSR